DTELTRQAANFIGKIDLERMECIARIFHHFRGTDGSFKNGTSKRVVDVPKRGKEPRMRRPHDGEWRVKEILDRCSFTDKFRINANGKIYPQPPAAVALNDGSYNRFDSAG